MTSPRDLRLLLLVKAVVGRKLKDADDRHRAGLLADEGEDPDDAMVPGERKAVHVRTEDGSRVLVGHVRADPAPVTVKVESEAALLAWVQENAPTEVVDAVRPSFRDHLLDQVKKDDQGRALNPRTGELVEPPGIVRDVGGPKVVASPVKGADEVLADAFRRGELPQFGGLMREIGPGESSE